MFLRRSAFQDDLESRGESHGALIVQKFKSGTLSDFLFSQDDLRSCFLIFVRPLFLVPGFDG